MKVLPNGIWDGMSVSDVNKEHAFDDILCKNLILFFKERECECIVDLGCGLGNYVNEFKKHFICDGFDGNPSTRQLTKECCNVLDLSVRNDELDRYDWVMSLEVGEHIPKCCQDVYIDNLCKTCKHGIVLSWAIPGQGGCGHINNQSNESIINVMKHKGFSYDVASSLDLRGKCKLGWFKNTIMVFLKN
jgi:hypothetical protein